jgi:hypothetical protein
MSMTLLEKYLQGDSERVYDEIYKMGKTAFDPNSYPVVESVLSETFKRVARNLEIIHNELVRINYCFKTECKFNFEYPLLKPLPDVASLLARLDACVKRVGYVPLSIKLFYKIVGSCNFAWNYDANPDIPWEGADPIQVAPINDLLSELENFEDDDDFLELGISADYLHKDNISGGMAYSIEITKKPQIDSQFLNEEHNATFIDYLRLTMRDCGFSRADVIRDRADFIEFSSKVRPKLYKI